MRLWEWTLLAAAGLGLGAPAPAASPVTFARTPGSGAVIAVDAARPADYRIPRTIYGTFLEPIGHSIYGGLWAQVLENPSFEDNLWSAGAIRGRLESEPALVAASRLGLPLPWEPLDAAQGARYEPRWGDAANSARSLLIMALPQGETGVRQRVYLPVHRELRYTGYLYAKLLSGPPELRVSLRRRDGRAAIFAGQRVPLAAGGWQRYEFAFQLQPGQVAPLEPADFAISAENETRVLVDQAMLFPADHVEHLNPEMVAMARALHTPVVRYGGNFTSAYHWRDGIGPVDRRVSMLNLAWGMPEYNQFGTEEFLAFCRLIGAAPQIALNLGSGTPDEAAGWVRYVNQHWGDRSGGLLWELGNELWGTFQTGYPTRERVAARTRAFSEAVRQADPRSRLIATGADPDHFEPWNAAQLEGAPGAFDFLSTHFVVGDGDLRAAQPAPDFAARAALALPVGLERQLRRMRDQVDASAWARGRVRIAFTEWLFHGPNDRVPRFSNMGGALCAAGFLNALMRAADIVPVADMTGLVEFGGIWQKRGRVFGVPAYWAFRMYSNTDAPVPLETRVEADAYDVHEGVRRLPEIADVPLLDVVAARNKRGDKLTLFCVNRDTGRDIPARIRLSGFQPAAEGSAQVLAAASLSQTNDEEHPEAVRPVSERVAVAGAEFGYTFRRASVTVLEIPGR